MNNVAPHKWIATTPDGSWALESDSIVYRTSTGVRRYAEPVQRIANSWDLIDCLSHLCRKPGVDDATLAAFVRFVDRLLDPPTAYPRGVRAFDAAERIAEIQRRRESRIP